MIINYRSCYDVPLYDNISDFSENGLSHVLALTPSIVSPSNEPVQFYTNAVLTSAPLTNLTGRGLFRIVK